MGHKMGRWLLVALLAAAPLPALAQPAPAVAQRELIYCADLMTHDEREAYRRHVQAARTPQEKEAVRAAHRRDIQERARAAGREGECDTAGRQWRGGRGK